MPEQLAASGYRPDRPLLVRGAAPADGRQFVIPQSWHRRGGLRGVWAVGGRWPLRPPARRCRVYWAETVGVQGRLATALPREKPPPTPSSGKTPLTEGGRRASPQPSPPPPRQAVECIGRPPVLPPASGGGGALRVWEAQDPVGHAPLEAAPVTSPVQRRTPSRNQSISLCSVAHCVDAHPQRQGHHPGGRPQCLHYKSTGNQSRVSSCGNCHFCSLIIRRGG